MILWIKKCLSLSGVGMALSAGKNALDKSAGMGICGTQLYLRDGPIGQPHFGVTSSFRSSPLRSWFCSRLGYVGAKCILGFSQPAHQNEDGHTEVFAKGSATFRWVGLGFSSINWSQGSNLITLFMLISGGWHSSCGWTTWRTRLFTPGRCLSTGGPSRNCFTSLLHQETRPCQEHTRRDTHTHKHTTLSRQIDSGFYRVLLKLLVCTQQLVVHSTPGLAVLRVLLLWVLGCGTAVFKLVTICGSRFFVNV